MHRLIKKYEKKLMAIFAVLLMVSFVATLGVRGPGGGRSDVIVAHMGDTPIHDSEMQSAKDQWSWLDRTDVREPWGQGSPLFVDAMVFTMIPRPSTQNMALFQQWVSQYLIPTPQTPQGKYRGATATAEAIAADLNKHPELFYLLQAEADEDGVRVSPVGDEVNEYLRNQLHADPSDVPANSMARAAIGGALSVTAEVRRLMDAMKISTPVWQRDAAMAQSIRLSLVDFRTSDFQKSVPAPTTQQIQQQFDEYKDLPTDEPTPANPLGFGYQIPARVKLQYLEIPHAQVVDAVIHHVPPSGEGVSQAQGTSDPLYDRQVQAAMYYQAHLDEFHNTPPKTQPAEAHPATRTASTTQPATKPTVAASEPAIKPFAEVKQQIIEQLAADDVAKETTKIAEELRSKLNSDFELIRRSDPAAVEPSTRFASASHGAASTQSSAAAMMFSHLEQIRNDIEQKYFVSVQLHDIVNEWQTATNLAALPGIGTAGTSQGASFPDYATQFADAIGVPSAPRLDVWQPSRVLTDGDQNAYVFRLTAAQPPHAPPQLKDAQKQLTQDWKLARAYDMALAAAGKAYASAQNAGLSQAARIAGQDVLITDLFQPRSAREIPRYPLPDAQSNQTMIAAAMDLLKEATPANQHPDKLVALPAAERVVVMELGHVQLNSPQWLARQEAVEDLRQSRVQKLAAEWFSYDAVVARTKYKAEKQT